jgi:hypothetical protein
MEEADEQVPEREEPRSQPLSASCLPDWGDAIDLNKLEALEVTSICSSAPASTAPPMNIHGSPSSDTLCSSPPADTIRISLVDLSTVTNSPFHSNPF